MRMRKGQVGQVGPVGRVGLVGLSIALLVGAAACNNNAATTTAATTTPTVTRTTDTFSGTVPVSGADFHSFPVAATGTIDVTLTVAGPPSTIVMGVSLGTPANGICAALVGGSAKTPAGAAVQLSGIASPATLCVDVHDVGNQTAPVSYTVTVTHP
ncbi:MAG TPA: hypothetical protein VKI43_17985 [Vicinamibacterales bacterium]|nr:hypothetical protein [Vicinamibacterales bacterium]